MSTPTPPTGAYVTLALSGDGRAFAAYGPFKTEREADAFGLAHCPVWTIFPLEPGDDDPTPNAPSRPGRAT